MPRSSKIIIFWLLSCAFMVLAMTIIGAITRLSGAGLSMVEWRPLMGTLPPLNAIEWQRVFALYQQSPEYKSQTFWMELSDFKQIFFWEWFHRLWGRLIGLVFALPLLWFWIRKTIPATYHWKFFGLLCLGGAQGLMGWYMVQSGLVDMPAVSHYRLAAHLLLALLIFTILIWLSLSLLQKKITTAHKYDPKLFIHALGVLGILIVTLFWGALTAGLDAGLLYNESFPKMGGAWVPPDIALHNSTMWNDFLNKPSGVQFIHRWLAMTALTATISLWGHAMIKKNTFWAMHGLGAMILIQFTLGLLTLFSSASLPLAVMHQAGAVTLLGLLIICLHRLYSRNT